MNLDKYLTNKSILFFLILFSLVIYTQNAWIEGFFHDGYLYAALGKHAALKGKWIIPFLSETNFEKFNQHPPFVFMIMGLFFKVFGSSFTAARVFGASWTIASIILFSLFIRKSLPDNNFQKRIIFFTGIVFLLINDLIKKSRFPGLDTPLMFSFILNYLSFFHSYKLRMLNQDKLYHWLITGSLLGISLLIKGPPALIIPLGYFIFLIMSNSVKETLINFKPWAGLSVGFIIFSIWPLLLYYNNHFYIFEYYIKKQFFFSVVEGRGNQENNI